MRFCFTFNKQEHVVAKARPVAIARYFFREIYLKKVLRTIAIRNQTDSLIYLSRFVPRNSPFGASLCSSSKKCYDAVPSFHNNFK